MIILALQTPIFPMNHGRALGSSPLDDNQPPPKISPVPGPKNNTVSSEDMATGIETTIVILVEFSNLNHTQPANEIDRLVFEDLNRYYQEVSFGLLSLTGETVGWYRLNYTLSYYGRDGLIVDDPNFDGGIDSWWLIRDAVKAADDDVDFAQFDHIIVVHAGNGQESSKVTEDIWSVAYSGLWIKTDDTRSVQHAVVVPETEARGAVPFGVFAHEFGHELGLPDLYQYGSSKSYVEHWGLMDRGLWNGNPKGSSPAHPMAYSKIKLGWIPSPRLMIVNASMNVNVTLQPTELKTDGYQAVKIPVKSMEYYLVEVRQKIGYDAYLPSNGVLISYVNERLASGYGRVKIVDSHTLTASLDDAAFDVGRVFAEPNSKFSVTILSTDGKSYSINVDRSGPAPDITIKDIRLEPSAARTNETVKIYADVTNQGTAQAKNFIVNCYIDDILYDKVRLTLNPGSSTIVAIEWKAVGGSHKIRFSVDPTSLAVELNRNNDALSKNIAIGLVLRLLLPKDVQVSINGTVYSADDRNEITLGILPGAQQIEVSNVQSSGNSTRRVFVKWSDNVTSNSRTLLIESDLTLGAEYKTQYYVTVNANGGSVYGEGWYDEASTANIGANTPCNEVQERSRSVFTGWSGDSATDTTTLAVTVDRPYSFTANWKVQYYLSVESTDGTTSGSGWYDANTIATFSIEPTTEIGTDTRKYFIGWTGDTTTGQPSSTITMDSPKSISATWRVEYFLSVVSLYGAPEGEGWYESGTMVSISVESRVDQENGTRRVFIGWTGDISTPSSTASTTLDRPKTASAEWKTQYELSFTASGLPDGTFMNITVNSLVINGTTPFTYSEWYDSQTTLELNVTKKVTSGFRLYVFDHWVNSTGLTVSDTITVEGPDTLTAVYTQSLGCVIATATFESELSPEVHFLRNFRDQKIMKTFAGSRFMRVFNAWYYSFSPAIAVEIAENTALRGATRLLLYPLIGILHLSALVYEMLGFSPEVATVATGFIASYLIGVLYFAPILGLALALARKRIKSLRCARPLLCVLIGSAGGIALSNVLMLDLPMMLLSASFVLACISVSAMLTAYWILSVSRKLNWNGLKLLQ